MVCPSALPSALRNGLSMRLWSTSRRGLVLADQPSAEPSQGEPGPKKRKRRWLWSIATPAPSSANESANRVPIDGLISITGAIDEIVAKGIQHVPFINIAVKIAIGLERDQRSIYYAIILLRYVQGSNVRASTNWMSGINADCRQETVVTGIKIILGSLCKYPLLASSQNGGTPERKVIRTGSRI